MRSNQHRPITAQMPPGELYVFLIPQKSLPIKFAICDGGNPNGQAWGQLFFTKPWLGSERYEWLIPEPMRNLRRGRRWAQAPLS